jgi:hypothetical protein
MPRQGLPTRPKPGKRQQVERRRAVRLIPPPEAVCYWSHGSDQGRARVFDISAQGLSVVIGKPLGVGSEVTLDLINGPHTYRCTRRLRVLRVVESNDRASVVAGEFDHALSYAELLPFFR